VRQPAVAAPGEDRDADRVEQRAEQVLVIAQAPPAAATRAPGKREPYI
jgi:hypothetical protein